LRPASERIFPGVKFQGPARSILQAGRGESEPQQMFEFLKTLYKFFLRMEKQRRGICAHCGGIRCYGACRFGDARTTERARNENKRPGKAAPE
jgi:hypothetical protein